MSSFRTSLVRLSTRPVPLSSVPPLLLRLPPKPTTAPSTKNGASPTIDHLLARLERRAGRRATTEDGRGLGNLRNIGLGGENVDLAQSQSQTSPPIESGRGLGAGLLPPNLRIEEFVPKRTEYSGVKRTHRELVRPKLASRAHSLIVSLSAAAKA